MKKRVIIICSLLAFVALGVFSIQAGPRSAEQTVDSQHVAVNRQTSVDCNMCFTCGGDWPIFAGSWASPGTNNVTERGSSCSGGLVSRTDSRPFLCCK